MGVSQEIRSLIKVREKQNQIKEIKHIEEMTRKNMKAWQERGLKHMDSLKEAVRELLRVVVLAVIPVAILSIEQGTVDLKAIVVVASVAALRFIDKYLYESGKMKKGLTHF